MSWAVPEPPARGDNTTVPTSIACDVPQSVPAARIRRVIGRLLRQHGVERAEVCVRITDDDAVRQLNCAYRGMDRTTDVLSFGYVEGIAPDSAAAAVSGLRGPLGDIVIAYPTADRQAQALRVPTDDELVHLCAHGCLHLLGHEDNTESGLRAMECLAYTAMGARGVALAARSVLAS